MHKFAVYGTLRQGNHAHEAFGIPQLAEYMGQAKVRGDMFTLGRYPGVDLDGSGEFVVEVYQTTSDYLMDQLDNYEGYDPRDHERSLYLRKEVETTDFGAVQIYEYRDKQYLRNQQLVESGDWNATI